MDRIKSTLIVIVDDEPAILSTVSEFLINKGFSVKGFSNAEALLKFVEKERPDLIILDLMLPGTHGFEVCKRLKAKERFSDIPIIIVSGDAEEKDKVSGLDFGADDYIVKPFSLNELNARIKVALRKKEPTEASHQIQAGELLKIDLQKYEVFVDGEKVELTPTEFKILEKLSSKEGQVFSRDNILDYLWGEEKIVVARTIDVHIRHLREKLGKAGDAIKNVRGIGYKFDSLSS